MKKVLFVDDSPSLLAGVSFMLKKASYETQTAASGEAALNLLKSGARPDLIITDLNMGGMNGIALIREARKIAALKNIPMLILTTGSMNALRQEARAAGASGWLVKPIDARALAHVVSELLPGGPQ